MGLRGEGRVVTVCVGETRGAGKSEVARIYLREDYGVVGDAHAGPGDKQVSLVDVAEVEKINRAEGLDATPGDFAANIGVEGLDTSIAPIGSKLRVGKALLEVTGLGKDTGVAHTFSFHGASLLVTKGVFCRVVEGGWVEPGDVVVPVD